ncbi:hypothetical protein [Streptosporangium sp. OZ121]|uniref:hypothetical protein n=1 Tax=Streptosporangium sp. OZ121 TaxID=3444183 RepID=UPI003F791BE6
MAQRVANVLDYAGRVVAGLQRGDWAWVSEKCDELRYEVGLLGTLLYPDHGRPPLDPAKVRERALALLAADRAKAITDYLDDEREKTTNA